MAQSLGENLAINIGVNVTGLPQVQQVQTRMNNLNKTIQRSTAQYTANAAATRRWSKGLLQQAGYQVGDFAVQVAGGTSAVQAFGQQGSQLLGVFGPVGALLGAGVAIFSAFAVAAGRAGGEVNNLGSVLGQLQEPFAAVVDQVKGLKSVVSSVMSVIVENIDTAIIAAGLFAVVLGVKMVGSMIKAAGSSAIMSAALMNVRAGMVAASISTGRFSMALGVAQSAAILMGGALKAVGALFMRFLPIAVIAGLAKAVEMFLQLRGGAGGTAVAFGLLRNVAIEVFDRIVTRGQLMYETLKMGINGFKLSFINALVPIAEAFDRFAVNLQDKWNQMFPEDSVLAPLRMEIAGGFALGVKEAGAEIQASIDESKTKIAELNQSLGLPNQSVQDIRDAFRNGATDVQIFGDKASEAMGKVKGATDNALGSLDKMFTELDATVGNISKTIEDSLTSGFMAMVDGTKTAKDAFRDMAKAIIAELYKVLVVQQLVGSVKEGTGLAGAIGGALGFSGARASGGQVTANKAYLVGERGPEMLVPSRNAHVIPNSKMGGGGGPVTVNYSFQGGVTEADLGRALPLLVERTKREVVDAVQRGGSVARVFR